MTTYLLTETNDDVLSELEPQDVMEQGWCYATLEEAKAAAQNTADYLKDDPQPLSWAVEDRTYPNGQTVTRHSATQEGFAWLIREFRL